MISGILAFLAIATAPVAWCICRKRKTPRLIAFGAAFALGGILYFGASYSYGLELEREMYHFDLNGDREFSADELTDEAKAAIKRWSSDTGRSFAPVAAPIAALIWTSVTFFIFWGFDRLRGLVQIRNENRA